MKTVGIDLWGGQARGGSNHATVMRPVASSRSREFREMFVAAYARFAAPCREVDEPGVALIAVHEATGRPVGLVRLRARVARHVAAIVGRHDECDLFLDASAELALRHLVVLLDPVRSWDRSEPAIGYRILDLRTERGFTDEDGRTLRGLRAEGPAFLKAAGHAVFVLPLGDPTDWPASADDAWAMLPERVYFDELACTPDSSLPRMAARSTQHRSMIMRTQGPRDTGMGLVHSGDLAGILEITGPVRSGDLAVGQDALRDGVLLGRYARCDGSRLLEDPSLSRVHAVLIAVDDTLLAIDTASRNGTRIAGEHRQRVIAVSGELELGLGKQTRIRWRWMA